MGATLDLELRMRANRALAQTYGRMFGISTPAPGKLTYGPAALTLGPLPVGRYSVYAKGGDVAISDTGAAAAADGTCPIIRGGDMQSIWLGGSTGTFTLSAIQLDPGGGSLFISSLDDVG